MRIVNLYSEDFMVYLQPTSLVFYGDERLEYNFTFVIF